MMTLTYEGRTLTVSEWAEETGLTAARIHSRIRKGYSDEEVLNPGRGAHSPMPYHVIRAFDRASFAEDDVTWYITHVHPDGLTLEEVGLLFGVSSERVRQIEELAIRKLGRVLEPHGVECDLRRVLREVFALRAQKVDYDEWSAA